MPAPGVWILGLGLHQHLLAVASRSSRLRSERPGDQAGSVKLPKSRGGRVCCYAQDLPPFGQTVNRLSTEGNPAFYSGPLHTQACRQRDFLTSGTRNSALATVFAPFGRYRVWSLSLVMDGCF